MTTRSKSQYKDLDIPFGKAAKEASHQLMLAPIFWTNILSTSQISAHDLKLWNTKNCKTKQVLPHDI